MVADGRRQSGPSAVSADTPGDARARFAQVPLLECLPEQAVQRLWDLSRLRTASAGSTLSGQGIVAETLPVLLRGTVDGVIDSASGRSVIVESWHAPSVADKVSVFSRKPRSVRLVAAGPVAWCEVALAHLEAVLDEHPIAHRHVARMIAASAARTRDTRVRADTMTVEARLALWMLEHRAGAYVRLPVPQERLAEILGTTRVSANRTLRQMAADGIIETASGEAWIRDLDALAQMATAR